MKVEKLKNNISDFFALTRAYALGVTLASCFVIYSYAHYCERFSFLNFLILVIALCCVHLGANLYDDYIDIKNKLKEGTALQDINFKRFANKAQLIINGSFSIKQVKIIISILFSIAIVSGLYFSLISGFTVLIFALLGGLLTLFYPISPKYYLGEVTIGLIYGPLMIMGGHFALCGYLNSNLFILSFAIFFATIVLLHTDNIMDWEFDVEENKKTLAILSGNKNRAISALRLMIISAYSIVVAGVISGRFNPHTLYCFLTLPIAVKLIESMKDYINIKDVKFETRWYWGIFENWQSIKEIGLDFFMFRFYLARNFSLFFALFVSIGAII